MNVLYLKLLTSPLPLFWKDSFMIFFFNYLFSVCSRCLKGEGEIEKLQTKVLELQRKLDNTTAAVQELGRENQSLQVSHLRCEAVPQSRMDLLVQSRAEVWLTLVNARPG